MQSGSLEGSESLRAWGNHVPHMCPDPAPKAGTGRDEAEGDGTGNEKADGGLKGNSASCLK